MTESVRPFATLGWDSLHDLPSALERPNYTRASLQPGIVHFGPGNFHRAHQGIYIDALMNTGDGLDWAVVGSSVMPADSAIRDALSAQDFLTTIVSQSVHGVVARVSGAMFDYCPVADSDAILSALTDPRIRIVSLTVTEGGYFIDSGTGAFDTKHPQIQHDIANPSHPSTVFGLIVEALRQRRAAGHGPFTVMSCDNVIHNGDVTKQAVIGLAGAVEPELSEWIAAFVTFPNSMVDRIAPATSEREREFVRAEFGVDDAVPVFCEDYLQWVIEDRFVAGRPALERVGVQFVEDVTPYELMKVRILNGGHAAIAYAAALLDYEFVHEALGDRLLWQFLRALEQREIVPTVPPIARTDLSHYLDQVMARIANPAIGDTVQRLCFDGSNRQPKFILPTVRDRLLASQSSPGLALVSALWCRYCFGETESGQVVQANDPSWVRLQDMAGKARVEPMVWLQMREIYGDLGRDARFCRDFSEWLNGLWQYGTRVVLSRYLAD